MPLLHVITSIEMDGKVGDTIQLAILILVIPKSADIKGMVFHEKIPFLHSKIWSKHPVLKYFNINPT